MPSARIRRLTVTNFRSYRAAQLEPGAGLVVLVGPNGSGKTNLIEAISFLAPGRGLRRATLEDIAFSEGDGSWAVSAEVEGALGLATLGTGIERQCEPVEKSTALGRRPVEQAVHGRHQPNDAQMIGERRCRCPDCGHTRIGIST